MTKDQKLFYEELSMIQDYYKEACYYNSFTEKEIREISDAIELNEKIDDKFPLKGIPDESIKKYMIFYISHSSTERTSHNVLSHIRSRDFGICFQQAFNYFCYTNVYTILYELKELFNADYSYDNIIEIYPYITDQDKTTMLGNLKMVLGRNYDNEILLYRIIPNYKIQYDKLNLSLEDNLIEYDKYVKTINVELLLHIITLLNIGTNSAYDYARLIVYLYKFLFYSSGSKLGDNDYFILAVMMDSSSLKEENIYFETSIHPNMLENFERLSNAYIEYVSTRNHGIIKNRLTKLINSKRFPIIYNKANPSEKTIYFGMLLFKSMINYDGDNKFLLKSIIDSQI